MVKRHYDESELLDYVELEPKTETLVDKTILLHFDSFCLGDTICFASLIEPFIDFHKPKKVLISTFFPHLLKSTNLSYEFINANQKKKIVVDKLINVGYDKGSLSHTLGGMFYAAKEKLMIPQNTKPVKPPMILKFRNPKPNKITIAPESLKDIAKWTKDGWQSVVNKLVDHKYDVYNVSYENTMNLQNVTPIHGNDDINISIDHILDSKFFIGLSSGLAWVAWAYGVPVVMISGFTKDHNEFDCFRVRNHNVCNGCFNVVQNIKTKCPIFLGTNRENECHKTITSDMVIDQINNAIKFTNNEK